MAKRICIGLSLVAGLLSGQDGASLYQRSCAMCHDAGADRAPTREGLRAMSPERVLAAMESGPMISMANRLTTAERRAIATFVTGKSFGQPLASKPSSEAMCKGVEEDFRFNGPSWNGWGAGLENTRYQDAPSAGLSAADVPRLRLKWAFGFPGDISANAQPAIVGGRVFVGSPSGMLYSLSAASGCVHWYFAAQSSIRSAPTIARVGPESASRLLAFFGDQAGNAYALDARTGDQVWKIRVDSHRNARVTGAPALYKSMLYIPVSSTEEALAYAPDFSCCKFRGSVVAVDAATGKQIWKTYTIAEAAKPTIKNKNGVQQWGPAGAPIWSSPTIDARRNALYVTTGDNYSEPATNTSDAFLAMDLDSGKLLWSRQMTRSDAYNVACRMPDKTNCPASNGPDLDFGSSPILVTFANGKRALVAGQKSGVVHAIDPDQQGEVLWQVRIGKGGSLGGVQWGSAADRDNIYVALSDIGRVMLPYSTSTEADPKAGGGMFALRLDNGERMWYTPPPGCGDRPRCSPAQSAAVTAIAGVVFSGSVDGHLRAYSTKDGKIIWDYDALRTYEAVNGVPARGGSFDGPGPAIAGGLLVVNSGYANWGGTPGNVLLAFSAEDAAQ